MATTSHPNSVAAVQDRLPGRKFDHLSFSRIALLLAPAVFAGFARTYYLAGIFRAPLPSLIIHLHGAASSIWIGLFVTQTALVSARRVTLHRRLGVVAFILLGSAFLISIQQICGLLGRTNAWIHVAGWVQLLR